MRPLAEKNCPKCTKKNCKFNDQNRCKVLTGSYEDKDCPFYKEDLNGHKND